MRLLGTDSGIYASGHVCEHAHVCLCVCLGDCVHVFTSVGLYVCLYILEEDTTRISKKGR